MFCLSMFSHGPMIGYELNSDENDESFTSPQKERVGMATS